MGRRRLPPDALERAVDVTVLAEVSDFAEHRGEDSIHDDVGRVQEGLLIRGVSVVRAKERSTEILTITAPRAETPLCPKSYHITTALPTFWREFTKVLVHENSLDVSCERNVLCGPTLLTISEMKKAGVD